MSLISGLDSSFCEMAVIILDQGTNFDPSL